MTDPPACKTEGLPCSPASTIETAMFKVVGRTKNGDMGGCTYCVGNTEDKIGQNRTKSDNEGHYRSVEITDPSVCKTEGLPCSPASTIETATFQVVGPT